MGESPWKAAIEFPARWRGDAAMEVEEGASQFVKRKWGGLLTGAVRKKEKKPRERGSGSGPDG